MDSSNLNSATLILINVYIMTNGCTIICDFAPFWS